ncbi:hypothetical protein Lser_V15G20113 [Lactuca serriola]
MVNPQQSLKMQSIQTDLSGSSSQQQFPADKLVYHDFFMPPPQHTAMRPLMHSRNPLPGASDETDRRRGGGASLSQFVHTKNSVYRVIDPYEADDEFANQLCDLNRSNQVIHYSLAPVSGMKPIAAVVLLFHILCTRTLLYIPSSILMKPVMNLSFHHHNNQLYDVVIWSNLAIHFQILPTKSLNEDQTVKQYLRPLVTLPDTTTIYEARCHMAASDVDFLVLIDSIGLLSGILTQEDIATRVINHGIDHLVNTPVSKVMTWNPIFVLSDTLYVEALQKMVQGEVTRLPVIEKGEVIGLVCIMDCLRDADKIMGRKAAKLMAANWDALERYC